MGSYSVKAFGDKAGSVSGGCCWVPCSPAEGRDTRGSGHCQLPVWGSSHWKTRSPPSQLCLCFLPIGVHGAPSCRALVPGGYARPRHHWRRAPGEQRAQQPTARFVQCFQIWAEKPQKYPSLLPHWLLAACHHSSPGIASLLWAKSKQGAERLRPAQALEAAGESLELAGSSPRYRGVRMALSCVPTEVGEFHLGPAIKTPTPTEHEDPEVHEMISVMSDREMTDA